MRPFLRRDVVQEADFKSLMSLQNFIYLILSWVLNVVVNHDTDDDCAVF